MDGEKSNSKKKNTVAILCVLKVTKKNEEKNK